MRYLFLSLYIFLQLSVLGQTQIAHNLTHYRSHYLPEKVFVHTDKEVYAAGETLWMASYLVDGQTHKLGAFSTFVRVELRNAQQELIEEVKLFSPEGHASASIILPANLRPGRYQIIAYTNYQRNTGKETLFQKSIEVVSGLNTPAIGESGNPENYIPLTPERDKIQLRFFPEGGDCVTGLPCQMAITAEDQQGNPREVEGYIGSSSNPNSVFFKTNSLGMGVVGFLPKAKESYRAKIASEDPFELPSFLQKGFTLQVINQKAEFQLVIQTNIPKGLEGAKIVVHHRGLLFLEEVLDVQTSTTVLPISKKDLIPGVYVATIFTPSGEPVAERLFFSAPKAIETEVEISLGSKADQKRSQVEMKLRLPPQNIRVDSLDGAVLSLSIIPTVGVNEKAEEIRTWFLINSDVNIPIPDARNLIFQQVPHVRDQLLNQWLMTRGWRRFRWKDISSSFEPQFELERGLFIKGNMRKKENPDAPQPGKVFLSILKDNLFEETLTDQNGNFRFGPYLIFDTTEVILQGRFKLGKKGKNSLEKINFEDNPQANLMAENKYLPPTLPPSVFPKKSIEALASMEDYTTLSQDVLSIAKNFDSLLIQLEEVEITAERISPEEKRRNDLAFYGNPTRRMVVDSVPGARDVPFVRDLLLRMPGVTQIGGAIRVGGPTSFQGSQTPLLLVDGLQVPWDYLANISVRDIDFIDLLKGPDASIFGTRGANNVILIYTRLGSSLPDLPTPGLLRFSYKGFHKAREFAVFDYEDPKNLNRPDMRTTLHWNPHIKMDGNSEHLELFKTSDQSGAFEAIIQGVRNNGQPLWGRIQFEVK